MIHWLAPMLVYLKPSPLFSPVCVLKYSLRLILFVLFEKSNLLNEYYLLFCLPFKNVEVFKKILK